MKARMAISGLDTMQKNADRLAKKYGKEVADANVAGGHLVRTAAIKSIQRTSSGDAVTRYRLGGGRYQHTASKPGDAPNTDTGRLVRSIQVETRRRGVYVGSTVEYAPMLEFGTKRMQERPWLNPALESQRRQIVKLIADAVRRTR